MWRDHLVCQAKSNTGFRIGLLRTGMLILSLLPFAASADIPTLPSRLHRIGFEIFKKDSPRKQESPKSAPETIDEDTPLTAAEEKELQDEIAQLKVLFGGKTEMDLGDCKTVTFEEMVRDLRKNFRKFKRLEEQDRRGELLPEDAWKYPRQVTEAERMVFRAKIDAVKAEVQKLFDAEYERMNDAGELGKIGLFKGGFLYRYQRAKRELASENALTVIKSVLVKNEQLRMRCEGVPVEWLADAMKCPEPSIDDKAVRAEFAKWSFMRMPSGLVDSEREIIFAWQFFVVEREKRPWRKLVLSDRSSGESDRVRDRRSNRFADTREGWGEDRSKTSVTPGFEDFAKGELAAADFVEFWYDKATAAGMKPSTEDKFLLEKARAAKNPWAGCANISLSTGFPRKIKIHGTVSGEDLRKAHLSFVNGLGMDERTGFNLELDEFDSSFLRSVAEVFGDDRIDRLSLSAGQSVALDLTPLVDFEQVRTLVLRNCTIGKSALLSGWKRFERFEAKNSTLGELTFLSGCAGIREIKMEGCAFSGLENLWATEWLRELALPNSRDTVDLAVVRKLEHLNALDITGCCVTNFMALKEHPSLGLLKMANNRGGVDSMKFLAENRELREVKYSKEDFEPPVYLEYSRRMRQEKYKDDPERLLEESVKDRDFPEIRRLCATNVKADDALGDFEFARSEDMEIFRLLVPNASPQALSEQLQKCVSAFGYGRFSAAKNVYVPTNRMEIVSVLLKYGANPDDAMKNMVHPDESDFAWFNPMVGKTSKTVLTELLQKNVKSFGNNLRDDCGVRHPADRLKVIRTLLKNGADPNVRNFFGKTVLGNAVEYDGDLALVKLLLDNGADASMLYPKMELFRTFYQGCNPVWGTNRYELVELLLAHGFDANAKGQFGKTPLGEIVFFAGWHDDYDLKMVKILLAHGADPNVKQGDKLGSATDLAYGKWDAQELLVLLEKHGGKVSDEAKRKKNGKSAGKESDTGDGRRTDERRPRASDRMRGRHGSPDGRMDRIREEMNRFHEQMRNCTDDEQRRELREGHSKRMREIHESDSQF